MIAARVLATLIALANDMPTTQQERGRAIYETGRSTGGSAIRAVFADGAEPIDAALVPCTACHGSDGRGRAEGNVLPADIRPETLSHALVSPTRTRPAYAAAQRKRAFTLGIDSAGQRLDRAMPRFQLSQADAADLLSYLDILGAFEPGVSNDRIVVNVVGAAGIEAPRDRIYGRHLVLQHDRREGAFMTVDVSADGNPSVAAADADAMPTIVLTTTVLPGKFAWILPASDIASRDEAAAAALKVVVSALNELGHEVHRDRFVGALETLRTRAATQAP